MTGEDDLLPTWEGVPKGAYVQKTTVVGFGRCIFARMQVELSGIASSASLGPSSDVSGLKRM